MTQTINTTFEPKSLPRWAQNDKNVVELCERNLSFRVNVFDATSAQMKRHLKREAQRLNTPTDICTNCEGTGFVEPNFVCPTCAGRGWLHA